MGAGALSVNNIFFIDFFEEINGIVSLLEIAKLGK
jgi:hypothetical protein